jgi:hypothetical protein
MPLFTSLIVIFVFTVSLGTAAAPVDQNASTQDMDTSVKPGDDFYRYAKRGLAPNGNHTRWPVELRYARNASGENQPESSRSHTRRGRGPAHPGQHGTEGRRLLRQLHGRMASWPRG